MAKDDAEAVASITNPRDVQGILAIVFGLGFLVMCTYAISKAVSFSDVLGIVNTVAVLVGVIIAFYFGQKAKQAAAEAAATT